jgi:hypothetical protein
MKSTLLFFLTFFGLLSVSGQQSSFSTLSNVGDYSETTIDFQLGEYSFQPFYSNGKNYLIPQAEKSARLLQKGSPDLIQFSRSLLIPDKGDVRIEIIDIQFEEIPNVLIAPSYGNLMRSDNPSSAARIEGEKYTQNAFFPQQAADASSPYLFRNARAIALHAYPLQYNPVTKILRINHSMRIRIVAEPNAISVNERNVQRSSKAVYGDQSLYERHFINYSNSRYDAPESEGKMLIISHGEFIESMAPFVEWKKQCGIPTEIVDVAELGGTVEIGSRIREEYYSNALRYVLLVGDIAQVPSPVRSGGKSDPSYGYIEGNDAYPEVQVGRFSAETVADVQTQVQRILDYEKASSGNHFSRVIGIGSQEGPGDDNEMDYEHIRNMHTDLLDYSFTNAAEFFEGSQGGNDAAGDPSAEELAAELNAGAGLVLYTGHGSSQSFATTGFSNADINNLSNQSTLPLIWAVACVNGEFDNGTCFAETWMRKSQNNQPAGAASVFMSSINQSWDPPMCAQDEMVDVLAELNSTNGIRTYGGISLSGCMQMNDEYGSAGDEMTDTWHIFGDPSLLVRTQTPLQMMVSHSSSVPIGISQLNVNVDVENARVALLQDGNLLASGIVSGGICTLTFDAIAAPLPLQVSVTAFNRIPYQGNIDVILPDGPFMIYNSNSVNDAASNNNQLADYNENFFLNVTASNVGNGYPGPLTGILTENSPFVTITGQSECVFYPVDNTTYYASNDCYSVQVVDGVADGTIVQFNLQLTSESGNQWSINIPLVLHAPEIQVPYFQFTELSGNGNGRADAGEQIRIRIPNENVGSSASASGTATLSHGSPSLQTLAENLSPNAIEVGSVELISFEYQIPQDFDVPSSILFTYNANFGAYNAALTFTLPVGERIEDFENTLPENLWLSGGDAPWTEDNVVVYEGMQSMKSGLIADNGLSVLELSGDVSENGEIGFSFKVSTEDGYDFLRFYVDDLEYGAWSGLVDWQEVSYPIAAGSHTFRWAYEKDDIVAANADAAWIDFVRLPNMESSQGIVNEKTQTKLTCFPNPVHNQLHIAGLQKGEFFLNWFDTSGRLLHSSSGTTDGTLTTSIANNLVSGIYFVQIIQANRTYEVMKVQK